MKKAVMVVRVTLIFFLFIGFLGFSEQGCCQSNSTSDTSFTLAQCVDYSLKHQPELQQALIGVDIVRTTNKISLSGWLPQAYLTGTVAHYLELPTGFINSNGSVIKQQEGIANTAIPTFSVSQAIFSPVLLYAGRSAPLYVKQAEQVTDSTKIFLVAIVSKSFYNLLQTLEQVSVLKEDTARLDKNLSDTYHQYVAGTVDETDYDEAAITLNNSKAQLIQQELTIKPQYAMLKQVMGFPPEKQFNVSFDTTQMMNDIAFDTTQQLNYEQRIEFQQLQTAKSLQHQVTAYYRNAFWPTVSAVFNYVPEFQSNTFPQLFGNVYPYSYVGLSISLPIFTGFARLENIHKSELQEHQLDWGQVDLKAQIYSDYASAIASYKSNLYNYTIMKDNEEKAKRVYGIVSLQYNQGVVAYLNVITAESNLISSEIGYVTALFQLLSSKIDLEKSMGIIKY
jgi:outer membrane protein TolC